MYGLSMISNDLADPKQRTRNQYLVFVMAIYVRALALQGWVQSITGLGSHKFDSTDHIR